MPEVTPVLIKLWATVAPADVCWSAAAGGPARRPSAPQSGFMWALYRNPPEGMKSASWNVDGASIRIHTPDGPKVRTMSEKWAVVDAWLSTLAPVDREWFADHAHWFANAATPPAARVQAAATLLARLEELTAPPGESLTLFDDLDYSGHA